MTFKYGSRLILPVNAILTEILTSHTVCIDNGLNLLKVCASVGEFVIWILGEHIVNEWHHYCK